ncbi:MAG: type II toxin-antitoxin system RelE/ParE family toxin [Archangium sp.]|nr:type II toxin-antitoxin system RelE/ParE family toxin [Archangium sp.]
MAQIVWTEPALSDLDAIADYIAVDKPSAARELVARVFALVAQLADFPKSGSRPRGLRDSRYRQIVEPPCRVFFRLEGEQVVILHVMRSEQRLRRSKLNR